MGRRRKLMIAGTLLAGMLLAGCGAGAGGGDAGAPPGSTSTISPEQQETATGTAPAEAVDAGELGDGAVAELRDGTWQVGNAGEVEFTLSGGKLALTEVRPADGWQHRVSDEKANEIEVHFTRDAMEWKFEVETGHELEISKELKIGKASPGTYQVGDAASVTFTSDGSGVTLGDVQVADGWAVTKRDVKDHQIELEFRNQGTGGKAEFEAKFHGGALRVEIDQKMTGPLPG